MHEKLDIQFRGRLLLLAMNKFTTINYWSKSSKHSQSSNLEN